MNEMTIEGKTKFQLTEEETHHVIAIYCNNREFPHLAGVQPGAVELEAVASRGKLSIYLLDNNLVLLVVFDNYL